MITFIIGFLIGFTFTFIAGAIGYAAAQKRAQQARLRRLNALRKILTDRDARI